MLLNTDSNRNASQYHHYIPRFILRRFKILKYTPPQGHSLARSCSQSDPEDTRIFLYEMSVRTLKVCPLRRAFGAQDLYRDNRDPNPNHIEESFRCLEWESSCIINHIHGAMVSPSKIFEITRKDLRILRKFLFLQSYRTSQHAVSYLMGRRDPLRGWIAQQKLDKDLRNDLQVWKYCLEYLLNTPHELLVQRGEETIKRIGQETVDIMRRTIVDRYVNWLDIDYATFARDYYMCICESSGDSEFILCDNSFGLGEGYTNNGDHIHKIYVLSPRIAVILRRLIFDDTLPSITGILAEIQMTHCSVKLARFDTEDYPQDIVDHKFEEYKLSPAASDDRYSFKIHKLTLGETHAVNHVVLYNLNRQGSLTFASSKYMLDTLTAYRVSHEIDSRRFDTLLGTLTELCKKIQKPTPTRTVTIAENNSSVAQITFEGLLQIALAPHGLPDSFPCAATLYHAAIDPRIRHPIATLINKLTADSIIDFNRMIPPSFISKTFLDECKRNLHLVDEIPNTQFDYFVHFAGYSQRDMAISIGERVFQVVIRAAAVGLIEWLVQHRPDVLKLHGLMR